MYETFDGLLSLFWPTLKGSFFDIDEINELVNETPINSIPNVMLNIVIGISENKKEHSREVYNLMDLIGDLGGVLDLLVLLAGIFICPISEHSFFLKAFSMLFLAKTHQSELLVKTNLSGSRRIRPIKSRFLSLSLS